MALSPDKYVDLLRDNLNQLAIPSCYLVTYKADDFDKQHESFSSQVPPLLTKAAGLVKALEKKPSSNLAARLLLVAGAFSSPTAPWCTPDAQASAASLTSALCASFGRDNSQQLLESSGAPLVLRFFQPFLRLDRAGSEAENWKRDHRGLQYGLVWCLLQVKHPHFGACVEEVIQVVSWLAADHETHNKILAISAFHHLANELNAVELWPYKDQLLQTLRHTSHFRELALTRVLLPCALALVRVMNSPSNTVQAETLLCEFLDGFKFLTDNPQMELYLQFLGRLIQLIGIRSVKYLKTIFALLQRMLELAGVLRVSSLEVLQQIITVCYPRMPAHANTVVKLVVGSRTDLTGDKHASAVEAAGVQTLKLLMRTLPASERESTLLYLKSSPATSSLELCLRNETTES
eukprot:gnl/Hemi2/19480_TR6474_c0_g1_i1.p1 gnl/Hemi2/19480_TR6474_c0_g1~~gnl/Hemi2/19480_TR6474_c0_g1_i1.p1  ORF type:complete len:406 (-),score=85.76 gnl/Hemi2/19480_TR6474_c0_g1_i1:233-1450(-)